MTVKTEINSFLSAASFWPRVRLNSNYIPSCQPKFLALRAQVAVVWVAHCALIIRAFLVECSDIA